MHISEVDTPITVALRLRIQELERENAMLRHERGVWPHNMPLTVPIADLAISTVAVDYLSLHKVASWDIKLDALGQAHWLGRAKGEKDELRLEYFTERSVLASREHQAWVLTEMLKRAIQEVAGMLSCGKTP